MTRAFATLTTPSRLAPLLAAATALVVTAAAPAQAQPARTAGPGANAYNHDRGLFIRLSAGVGFASASQNDPGNELTLSGPSVQGSFAIGGIMWRNLALHADIFGMNAIEPSVELNGSELGDARDTVMSMVALGVGATYYLMPINVYLSGSVGAAVGRVKQRFAGLVFESESEVGVAINAIVGKEWWVGRHWGMGIAGQFMFGVLPTEGGENINAFGLGLLFTATMN